MSSAALPTELTDPLLKSFTSNNQLRLPMNCDSTPYCGRTSKATNKMLGLSSPIVHFHFIEKPKAAVPYQNGLFTKKYGRGERI